MDEGFQHVLYAIAGLSFLVFVALFGHVPALRKTPIGWGYRFIWKTLPAWFTRIDDAVTGGRTVRAVYRLFNYLMYDKHPLIQLFYLGLVSGGLYLFWLGAWDKLWSPVHKVGVPIIASLPYITLYMASYSDPGYITRDNHRAAMRLYPFDYVNFKPGYQCKTCHFEKPARSKHCPICKHCVAKDDHHCVWINNCVGHKNIRYFFAFLFATNILLTYGFYLTFTIQHELVKSQFSSGSRILRLGWKDYFNQLMLSLIIDVWCGMVCLLCLMTGLLSYGFTGYHLYLLWCGTTTNETFKWNDWKDDIAHGEVWMARDPGRNPYTGKWKSVGPLSAYNWPVQTDKIVFRIVNEEEMEYLDRHLVWEKVESYRDLDNIYDVGFWKTVEGVVWPTKF